MVSMFTPVRSDKPPIVTRREREALGGAREAVIAVMEILA
jgi:hypothetical protein